MSASGRNRPIQDIIKVEDVELPTGLGQHVHGEAHQVALPSESRRSAEDEKDVLARPGPVPSRSSVSAR